jgi:hypothetical protein
MRASKQSKRQPAQFNLPQIAFPVLATFAPILQLRETFHLHTHARQANRQPKVPLKPAQPQTSGWDGLAPRPSISRSAQTRPPMISGAFFHPRNNLPTATTAQRQAYGSIRSLRNPLPRGPPRVATVHFAKTPVIHNLSAPPSPTPSPSPERAPVQQRSSHAREQWISLPTGARLRLPPLPSHAPPTRLPPSGGPAGIAERLSRPPPPRRPGSEKVVWIDGIGYIDSSSESE